MIFGFIFIALLVSPLVALLVIGRMEAPNKLRFNLTEIASIALLVVLGVSIATSPESQAEEMLPPCHGDYAEPPLVVVLPDGTEIPATLLRYDIDARRITVVGYLRIFCDSFEGNP